MAKKPRTPDPPRKIQAPKVRHRRPSRPRAGWSMPSTNVLIGVALGLLAALVVGLVVALAGGGGAKNVSAEDVAKVRAAMAAAGCSFTAAPSAAAGHMTSSNQKVTYKTFPPSSGIHNPTPAIWGDYSQPVDPRQAVHNLEHGGIVTWYGPRISAQDRQRLDEFYNDSPNGIVVTPVPDPFPGVTYPKHEPLGKRIAFTAWTAPADRPSAGTAYVAICPGVDLSAFDEFRDAFRGRGPERVSVSSNKPGT